MAILRTEIKSSSSVFVFKILSVLCVFATSFKLEHSSFLSQVNSDNYVPPKDVFTKRCIQKPSNELTHGFSLKHLAVSSMLFDVLMSANSVLRNQCYPFYSKIPEQTFSSLLWPPAIPHFASDL